MQFSPKTLSVTLPVCSVSDLIEDSGVCVLVDDQQIAIFYLPREDKKVFAVSNWDPIGKANVLSRGIVGDIAGELVVASPLYKQHFSLLTGRCLENEDCSVRVYELSIQEEKVCLSF